MSGRPGVLAALILCAGTSISGAQNLASTLGAAERAYHAAATFRADFTQTIENPMLGAPQRSRGVMYLNPPDRFAMRFTEPKGDRIVADGKWLWVYAPSTTPGQVIKQPVPKAGANTPNFIAQFVDQPLERYIATSAGWDSVAGAAVDLVRLVPRFNDQPFREAVIAVARKDGLLRRVDLVEESGQRRTIILPAPAAGAQLADEEFRFRVPRGVRVVTP